MPPTPTYHTMRQLTVNVSGESYPVLYINSISDIEVFIASFAVESDTIWGLDIETTDLEPKRGYIRTIQLYNPAAEEVYVLDVGQLREWGYTEYICEHILTKIKCVAHNALFEYKWLYENYPSRYMLNCTMIQYSLIAHATWYDPFENKSQSNPYSASLKNVWRLCRGNENDLDKAVRATDWGVEGDLSDDQVEYAAIDAIIARKLYDILWKKIRQHKMEEVFRLNMRAMYPITVMNRTGFYFDTDKHAEMCEEWDKTIQDKYDTVQEIAGDINLDSPKQVGEWLENNLSAEVLDGWERSEKTGQLSTSKQALLIHGAGKPGCEFIDDFLEYKRYVKLASTYGKKLRSKYVVPSSGCIHADYTMGFTATGRLSSRNPNIQNQPRAYGMRAIYIAKEKFSLAVADYGQIEIRIAGYLSGDRNMIEAFNRGEDIHSSTLSRIIGKTEEKVNPKEWKTLRTMAKAANFGLLYGSGKVGFQRYAKSSYGIDVSDEEAQKFVDGFRLAYPEYRQWQQKVSYIGNVRDMDWDEIDSACCVRTLGGKLRKVNPEFFYTQSMNTPIQGAAAELMLKALIDVQNMLEELPGNSRGRYARLVACVHDEIVVEYNEGHGIKEDVGGCIKNGMESAMKSMFPQATMNKLVDVGYGKSWENAK